MRKALALSLLAALPLAFATPAGAAPIVDGCAALYELNHPCTGQTCVAVAPLAEVCKFEIYMTPGGSGDFTAFAEELVLFDELTVGFYPKLKNYPGGYDAAPTHSCVTTLPNGCDGTYTDSSVGPFMDGVYLLVVELTGTPGDVGKWGWHWQW